MAGIQIALLGTFRVVVGDGPPRAVPRRKAEALLAYLGLRPGAAHPRDKLAALLWPDASPPEARHGLRQALLTLRRTLAPATGGLRLEGGAVALDPTVTTSDVAEFERLARAGTPGADEQAVALYRGDLLEGLVVESTPFEEWLRAERERLWELALEAMGRLLAHQVAAGAATEAIRTAERILALDPLQEVVHRALMRLYAGQQRRADALQQYGICVEVLRRELGVGPEAETRALLQTIVAEGEAWRPVPPAARRSPRSPAPGPPEPATPLVGRRGEIARLREALEAIPRGRGDTVIVLGSAGLGKTRLVEALADDARQAGVRVLMGHGHESEQVLPYRPWVDALREPCVRGWADLWGDLGPARRAELARLFPELAPAPPRPSRALEDHLRLFDAVTGLLAALARRQPTVVVLEDLHWADEMTVRLFLSLARRLRDAALLLVGTARREDLEDPQRSLVLHEVAQEPGVHPITLGALSEEETGTLVRHLAPDMEDARLQALSRRLWTFSEGNPFMIVEGVRAIGDGSASAEDARLLPGRVRDLLASRLARLSPVGRRVVAAAALVGREFDAPLLRGPTGLGEEEMVGALDELVRRGIVRPLGEGLVFTHERIREVAASEVLGPRRRLLHRRIAAALEQRHAGDPDAGVEALAHHHREAGAWGRAADHLVRLAEAASRRCAHVEAVRALQEVRGLAARLPGADGDRRAVDAAIRLQVPLTLLGRVPESAALLREHEPRVARLGEAAIAGRYHHALATARILMGDHALAAEAAERALREAGTCEDRLTMGQAHQALALVGFWSGQYAAASAHARESAALLEGVAEPYDVGTSHWIAALSHMFVGDFERSLEAAAALEAVGKAAGEPRLLSNALWTRGGVHAWRGECAEAVAACRLALDLAPDPVTAASATGFLGFALVEQGDAQAALRALREAVEQFGRFGMPHAQGGFMAWLAEAHLLAGDGAEARRTAMEGLEITRRAVSPHGVGGAQQVLGKIALGAGNLAEARRWYEDALATFEGCGARFEAGRTHLALAELAGVAADLRTADLHLEEADREFVQLDVRRYVQRVLALAARLGLGPRPWAAPAGG